MTNLLEKVGEYLLKDKIIFISCFLILLYQICELMQQYLQINLVTNIKFVNNEPESLPAITVCYNELYSYEKISKRFPNSLASEKYENFSTFMDKFYQSDWSLSVNGWPEEFNTFHQQYKEITNEIDRIVEHSKSETYNLYNDIFDNLTLPYTYEEDNVTKNIIQLELSGKVFADEMNAFVLDNQYQTYSTILSPLESIVNNRKKCFTFFNTICNITGAPRVGCPATDRAHARHCCHHLGEGGHPLDHVRHHPGGPPPCPCPPPPKGVPPPWPCLPPPGGPTPTTAPYRGPAPFKNQYRACPPPWGSGRVTFYSLSSV